MEENNSDIGMNFDSDLTEELEWKSLTITHVEYPKDDRLGLILAFCSLLPVSLIISFATLILFRRDIHTIFFFIGIICCEGLNIILKNTFAQPRPYFRENLYTEYGMPSSHSQLSWFFTTYSILFLVIRLRHNHECRIESFWKCLCIVGLTIASVMISYSRVYLLYHSWNQVIWGGLIGSFFGCVWFATIHILFTPLFPQIVSWSMCEFLMIRDTTLIPNILWFEYTQARTENRSRNRKLVSMKSQ